MQRAERSPDRPVPDVPMKILSQAVEVPKIIGSSGAGQPPVYAAQTYSEGVAPIAPESRG